MGGAKNCPETPRQRMIGMMYLVLTAMLALNVSVDILNGFNKIRHSMEASIRSNDARTGDLMQIFSEVCNKDEGGQKKYGEWLKIAKSNQKMCDDFYNYLEQFKLDIVRMVEGVEANEMPNELKNGSDTNKPHQYAINEKDSNTGRTHAEELRTRMDLFRQYMTSADSECLQKKMKDPSFQREWDQKVKMYNSLFSTGTVVDEEGRTIPWEQSIFEEMPAGAVYALLTKYQNDVRVAENDFLNFLFKSAGSSDFVINSVQALVIPTNGEYVMQGSHYRAKIVSAAVDTTNLPVVYINGQEYPDGIYDLVGTSVGPHTYNGYMQMPGDTTKYTFQGQYTVGAPSASISNVDMNSVYTGFDNKFSISVPGVAGEKIKVSATNARVSQKGSFYIVTPTVDEGNQVKISVYADVDGKSLLMGAQDFNVKRLPDPKIYFESAGERFGSGIKKKVTLSAIRNKDAKFVVCYPKNSDLQLNFTLTGFTIYVDGRLLQSKEPKLTADMVAAIGKLRANSPITLMEISYTDPGGNPRTLDPTTLILK